MKPKLSPDTGLHETTIDVFDRDRKLLGEIDVRILYRVTSYGRPAYISGPPENCYPEDPAEIDVIHVEMLGEPYATNPPKPAHYIPCWGWLYDLAIDWANEHANELASEVKLRRMEA